MSLTAIINCWRDVHPRVKDTLGVLLFCAVLGVMLFGDHLTAALVIGGLMILAGSFTVVLGEKGDATPAPI